MFGSAANMPLGMRVSHIKVPTLEDRLYSEFYLPADAHPGMQQVMAQVVTFLSTSWEI